MFSLEYNPQSPIFNLANKLREELIVISSQHDVSELSVFGSGSNRVYVAEHSLKDSLEKLIASLKSSANNEDILPAIVIAKGNVIKTENQPLQSGLMTDSITLQNEVNEKEVKLLSGAYYNYTLDLQVIILSRSGQSNLLLQAELKRLLNTSLRSFAYDLRVIDDTAPDSMFICRDYGRVDIFGFSNAQFESMDGSELGVKATFITGEIEESYFKLKDASVMLNAVVAGNLP